jgi:hypothetical protein
MEQLRLRPMTTAEFATYRAQLIPAYAAHHVQAGDWDPEQAETLAARQVDELLLIMRKPLGGGAAADL